MNNNEFADWTIDELQVAITTLEHDLRGSWAAQYEQRMILLCELCEAVMALFDNQSNSVMFKEILKGKKEYSEMAMHDIELAQDEMTEAEWQDGRVFRDGARFYDVELSDAGKTDKVIDWLSYNVVCDDWHWFDKDEA